MYASEVYVGLATTATSSVSLALDPSSVSATRISAAMIGQSVVQTGSRNASRTTLPRRLASETCLPYWLVSVKFGAGLSSWPLVPAIDSAVIGSAVLFTVANAIGAAPTMITPSAASPAITRSGAPANARTGPETHPGSLGLRGGADAAAASGSSAAAAVAAAAAGCGASPR